MSVKPVLNISQWSITRKLTAVIMAVSVITLAMAVMGFLLYELLNYPQVMSKDLRSLAEITGFNCAAALAFNDPTEVHQNLEALKAKSDIIGAVIYDKNGASFETYVAPGHHLSAPKKLTDPEMPEALALSLHGAYIYWPVVAELEISGKPERTGTLYMQMELVDLPKRLLQYALIVGILVVGILIITLLVSLQLQKVISHPILHLAEVARQVSAQKDYSLRAIRQNEDELGALMDAFNEMLAEVYNRDQDLQAANLKLASYSVSLEQEVQRRVFDLKGKTEEAEQARRVAERANRAKSEFLAQMSHELRTPLNGILGYAQILKKEKSLSSAQYDGVRVIERSGEHLLTLINDILDLSKIESRKLELIPEDFSLRHLLSDIGVMIQVRAEASGLIFKVETADKLPMVVHGDQKRLRQILLNLLGNAVKFTERGEVNLRVTSRGPHVHFSISDTGVGIPQEKIDEIFLPFHQVGDTRKFIEGTGLGLAISRRLVELMGGRLSVTSAVGQGSVFSFEVMLPEVHLLGLMKPGTNQRIIGYEGRRMTILVVDDLMENREIIQRMLEPIGFLIAETASGPECLRAMEKAPADLIIIDLMMPGMDGYEATRQLRKEGREVPIIASSASVFVDNQKKSFLAGSNDFLPKPIRYEDLMGILQKYLKLKWIYEVDESFAFNESALRSAGLTAMVIPSIEDCRTIQALVQRGDVKRIHEQMDRLEQEDTNYGPFISHIRQLLAKFKIDEIDKYIAQAMKVTV